MSNDFCHIHCHSDGSLLDAPATIKKIVTKAKQQGHTACAITDHGSMLNIPSFIQECQKQKYQEYYRHGSLCEQDWSYQF
jgi:DNA polymerase-3 subunit alpha